MPWTCRIVIIAAGFAACLSPAAAQEAAYRPEVFPAPVTAGKVGDAWSGDGFSCMATNLTGGYDVTRTNIIDERIAVVRGGLDVTVGGERHTLAPGDVVDLPAGTRRRQTTGERAVSRIAFGYGRYESPTNLCD